jgi:tRNA(fMet)-specific endonuclease VapC
MRRYLLDTGIASDYIHRRRGVYERAREEAARGHRIGICGPVLGELWYGVEYSSSRDRNAERLRRILPDLVVWPFDERAAEEFGRLAAELRRSGRPMQSIDIQIAAIALSLGNTIVVSKDSDLGAVPGLTGENWAEASEGGADNRTPAGSPS